MFELTRTDRNRADAYNPFRELERIERSLFSNPFGFFGIRDASSFRADIIDGKDEFIIEAELPGFKRDDITIETDGNRLTIKAERRSESEDVGNDKQFIRCERTHGVYMRQFDVSMVDTEAVCAEYDCGILRVKMPKKRECVSTARKIEIK